MPIASPPVELDEQATQAYAQLFHALADPTRLAIVQHLALGEHRVRDVVEHMGLAQSTVSKHLACLKDNGLVTSRAEGRASWFALADVDLLRGIITSAERLLATTGEPHTLCLHLASPTAQIHLPAHAAAVS